MVDLENSAYQLFKKLQKSKSSSASPTLAAPPTAFNGYSVPSEFSEVQKSANAEKFEADVDEKIREAAHWSVYDDATTASRWETFDKAKRQTCNHGDDDLLGNASEIRKKVRKLMKMTIKNHQKNSPSPTTQS